jgi:hypothetical protein
VAWVLLPLGVAARLDVHMRNSTMPVQPHGRPAFRASLTHNGPAPSCRRCAAAVELSPQPSLLEAEGALQRMHDEDQVRQACWSDRS